MQLLTIDSIRDIHEAILAPEEVRGERPTRLEAIHGRVSTRIDFGIGVNDVFDVAACFGAYIAIGHAFTNGNKRTAFTVVDIILTMNGFEIDFREEETELYELYIDCAQNIKDEFHLAQYLRNRFISSQAS